MMKQITMEEALKRVEELDAAVELLKKGSDVLERRALEQAAEITRLRDDNVRLGKGYASMEEDLAKAKAVSENPFLKAMVDFTDEIVAARLARMMPRIRQLHLEDAGGNTPLPPPSERFTLEKGSMEVEVAKTPAKKKKFSDADLSGKILTVILEGEPGKRWEAKDITPIIRRRWGEDDLRLIGPELKRLWEDEHVLGRVAIDNAGHPTYFIPEGVTLVPGVE